MTEPAISVVVPFFESAVHIAACIESLLASESRSPLTAPVQILFVDNGSSDGSSDIVRRYPQVELLSEPTPGAYAARNAGVRRARAPIIAFTDADCEVDVDWLQAIVSAMEEPELAILVGHCRYPSVASRRLRLLEAYENAKASYVLQRCPPAFHFAYANNMAVRRSVFSEIGHFKEWHRAGDTELVHRLAARRPHLRTYFVPSMRVTHNEFVEYRARAERLGLYTETNSKIATFRELSLRHRLAILLRALFSLAY